jgi:hypothetical protein
MCGKSVTGSKKQFWRYYICASREKAGCKASVNAQEMEERIIDIVHNWLEEPNKAIQEIVENQERNSVDYQAEIERLKGERESVIKALEAIPEKKEKFLIALQSGIFMREQIEEQTSIIRQDEERYRSALAAIERQLQEKSFYGDPDQLIDYFEGYREHVFDLDTRRHPDHSSYWLKPKDVLHFRKIAEKFIRKIILLPGDREKRRLRIEGFICNDFPVAINNEN